MVFCIACLISVRVYAWSSEGASQVPVAPTPGSQKPEGESRNSLTLFGTATFANNSFYAQTFDRHLSLVGLRYGRLLSRNRFLSVRYVPEIIPAAVLSEPSVDGIALPRRVPHLTGTEYVYGVGANPVGFELLFAPAGKIRPFLSTNEGFLYFRRNVPSFFAAQFNFAADVRAGASIRLNGERTISFAYVFHHFSNAFEARDNPGVDSQMIYVGYTFSFRRRHASRVKEP